MTNNSTKVSSTSGNKVAPIVAIIAIFSIPIIILLSNSLSTQKPTDCSLAEKYNDKTKRCVVMGRSEYLEAAKSEISDAVSDKIHDDFKNGSLCIPADETQKYVGTNGCVRLYVKHYYIESYGWAWLDAYQNSYQNGDFTIAALGKGIINKSDAEYYLGKWVSVRGTIELYKGETQIRINNKSAITDVSTENTPYLTQYSNLEDKYRLEIEESVGNCFETKIKNSSTKTAKDNAYTSCKSNKGIKN